MPSGTKKLLPLFIDLKKEKESISERRYQGPNPPQDILGQSFNDFYIQQKERMSRLLYQKDIMDSEVMTAAIKWINDNLGNLSFDNEDEEHEFVSNHLDRKLFLIRYRQTFQVQRIHG